ncbi:MAG: N-6 DNA methylase [Aggregatilineales bacterium]
MTSALIFFVCEAGLPDTAYIIVEVKQPRRSDGLEQLKSYCNAEGAPIAVWTNGSEELILHREDPNYYRSLTDLPRADQTLADVINERVTLEQLRQNDKLVREQWTLKKVILDLENLVLSHAQGDAFDEIFKLIYTKLYDEWKAERRTGHVVEFRAAGATRQQLYDRINTLFQDAKNKWSGVFSPADKIELTPDQLAVCVSFLQELVLFHSNLQVIDEAFEYLVTQVAKAEKGQYFTPRHVIDMCVKMLNPTPDEYVIDTAAGSCGFTIHTFFYVWNNELDTRGPTRIQSEYASEMVYGIDLDTRSVKIAKAINLIAGDGKTNVYQANTLNPESWDSVIRAGLEPRLRRTLTDRTPVSEQMNANRQDEDNRRAMRLFSFDVLLTNPPFAGDIRDKRLLQHYRLAQTWRAIDLEALTDPNEREKYAADPRRHTFLDSGKSAGKQSRDVLFIERNLEFLRPGGRMAIVLPQGRLNNITDGYVRQFLAEHCRVLAVVRLHGNTFKPHTGTKTSVLFVQKWNDEPAAGPLCPRVENYPVFFAVSQRGGKDNSGEYIYKLGTDKKPIRLRGRSIIDHDLDQIATAFVSFARENQLGFWKNAPVPSMSIPIDVDTTPVTWSVVSFVEVLKAGRLDAEFFRPKAIAAIDQIRKTGQWAYLGDLVTFCQRGVQPEYVPGGTVKVVNSKHLTETLLADKLETTSLEFWEKNPDAQLQPYDALMYSTGLTSDAPIFICVLNEPLAAIM